MERSRRELLRAGGALLVGASAAGCIEERVTRRETRATDSSVWALSSETDGFALGAGAFDNYVERMADSYGDSGVWGIEAERPDAFDTAYVQRYAITRETPGNPTDSDFSLEPETVDPEAPVLIADSCLARYDLGGGRDRYWLWVAADPTDGRLVRDINVARLSTGIRLGTSSVTDASTPSVSGGEGTVGLGSPPSGRFPVRGGSVGTTTVREAGGTYAVEWRGELDAVQSVNGVCEVARADDGNVSWTMSLGYNFEQTV